MSKIVFICHPVRGDVKKNVESAVKIMKEVHTMDLLPLAPYLESLYYLDDKIENERDLGMRVGFEIIRKGFFDELWVCGPRISEGMEMEIKICLERGIPIVCYNPALEKDFERIKQNYEKV